jgi:hypothetical protein
VLNFQDVSLLNYDSLMTQNVAEYFNNALPFHTLMACGRSEFIDPFIHYLGTNWRLAETALIITYLFV